MAEYMKQCRVKISAGNLIIQIVNCLILPSSSIVEKLREFKKNCKCWFHVLDHTSFKMV